MKAYNKTALITGAACHIGAAITEHLHLLGMNVIVHYNRSAAAANKLVRKLNQTRVDSAIALQADLKEKEYYALFMEAAIQFKQGLDVLINNAACFYPTPTTEINDNHWDEIIHANLKAPFFLSNYAAPSLEKSQGTIINITDIHALKPLKNYSIYSISKAGLNSMTQSLAKELGPHIRVNAIALGAITVAANSDEQTLVNQTMLKRLGSYDDVVKTVEFLIQDANYITGQIISVDGGKSLYS